MVPHSVGYLSIPVVFYDIQQLTAVVVNVVTMGVIGLTYILEYHGRRPSFVVEDDCIRGRAVRIDRSDYNSIPVVIINITIAKRVFLSYQCGRYPAIFVIAERRIVSCVFSVVGNGVIVTDDLTGFGRTVMILFTGHDDSSGQQYQCQHR